LYKDFSPILIFTGIAAVLVAVPFLLQAILSPTKNKGGSKLESYECGEVPEGSAWVKFNVRFYIIALGFLIFDVEILFMFPWAVIFQDLGFMGLIKMFIFMFILVLGFVYLWIKGDLDWVKMSVKYASGRYSNLKGK